jgi:hypothetical protein
MPGLPDVPQQDWQSFSADRWFKQSTDRINSISAMPAAPGLGFLTSSSNRINTLPQITGPQIQIPPIQTPQPTLPPLPTPAPTPAPVPAPEPAPLPSPLPAPAPSLPSAPSGPIGLPPSSTPFPQQGPPPDQGPPQGLPTPVTPQTPVTPGPAQPSLPTPPVMAPPTVQPPTQSPFGGEATGPFAPGTPEKYVPPTLGGGGGSQNVGYDPTSPAMQALNAAPQGDLQNYARQAAQKAGINPEIFAAQIQQESGYNPNAGSQAGAQGIAQIVPQYHPGVNTWDPKASLDYAANLMASLLKQYGGDWSKALIAYNGGGGAVSAWDAGQPYQESQTYVARILGSSRPNQTGPAPTPSSVTPPSQTTAGPQPTAMAQSQFGDPQLTSDEAYAACGPAAAVRFAQAYGRNPTLREATDLAKTVGWTPGQGMAGIASEQQLLEKMGVPTRLVGANSDAIAREAQTGNPVTISTSGHYFYADGYNPQTQQFHVGRSGLDLKNGSEWMTLSQMQSLMGPVQGALFANNPSVPATSSSAPPADHLDQTRQALSADLTGTPIPKQAMTDFGRSPDPALQQLDQAVQTANRPSPQQRPGYLSVFDQAPSTVASSGNPLDNLGSMIGNAIQSALQSALGGPGGFGPKGSGNQQDQQQPAEPAPTDVGSRARQMIEQIQTLPGGRKVSDFTGVPDLLPPDLKNMSIADALKEAVDRAGATAMNLPRPSMGPGGLGIFDPRLGNDPRMDIPDMLEPIGQALHGLGDVTGLSRLLERGAPERAASSLDQVFEREAGAQARGLTGGITRSALDDLGGGVARAVGDAGARTAAPSRLTTEAQQLIDAADRGGVPGFISNNVRRIAEENGVRITPDMTPNDVIDALRSAGQPSAAETAFSGARAAPGESVTATTPNATVTTRETLPSNVFSGGNSPIQQLTTQGQQSVASGLSRTRAQQAWDTSVRNLTDSGTDLNNIEKALAQKLGRPLTDTERVGLLARVDPTHQAENMVEHAIGPQLRAIGDQALPDFYNLVEHRTNQSVAEGLAKQVEQQALEAGIAPSTEQRLTTAMKNWNVAQNVLDEAQAQAANPRTRGQINLNTAQARVDEARTQLEAAAEVARQANADAAREQVMTAPGSKVTTLPEYRDLSIAEDNARRLNQQYDRLYARNPDSPYLETLARQVGRAEDRASQLRSQMGESSARRGAVIEGRAQTAADRAAAQQPRYNPTPEYAGASVKLRYEQQNLERLQAAQARGQRGLANDVAVAENRVRKAFADVQQAHADVPAAARAQGLAQLHGREFAGPNGETWHYDDIMQHLADLQDKYRNQPEKWQQMQDGLTALQDFRKQMLQEKVDHGLLPQAKMDGLLKTYDFWTPTHMTDFMSDERPGMGLQRGSSFNVADPGLHTYTPEGSSLQHENHVAAMIREAYAHKSGIAKNDVTSALVKGFGNDSTVMRRVADNVREYVDSGGKNGPLLHPDYPLRGDEQKVTGIINGDRKDYVTSNTLLKTALDQMAQTGDPSVMQKILQAPAKIVRATATERNPAFQGVNLVRDAYTYAARQTAAGGARGIPGNLVSTGLHLGPAAVTAAMTPDDDPNRNQKIAAALALGMGTRIGIGKNLGLGPSAARAYLLAFADAMRGTGSGRMTGEGVRALEAAGGGMGSGGAGARMTQSQAQEQLRKLTRQNAVSVRNVLTVNGRGDLKQLLNDVAAFGWVKALGNRFEQVPRVAAREMELARGSSPLEAMRQAREGTTDFSRGGRLSKEINRYVPFFNVGTQAPAQLGRLLKEHPAGAAFAGLTLLGAPASATEAYNYSDPQRAKDYEDVPDYLKKQGIVLMVPGEAPRDANGNRNPQKILIPIPNEFMPFVEAGREAFHHIQDVRGVPDQGKPRDVGELASTLTQELSPINAGSRNSVASSVYGFVPPGPGTLAELSANKDWYRDSTIANKFSDENASSLSKAVAPALEDAVTQLPGMSSARVRPSQVDFAIKDLLNGLGQQGLNLSDYLAQRAPRVPGTASELPVVGSLASRFVRGTGGQQWQDLTTPDAMMAPDVRRQMRALGDTYEPSSVPSDIQKIPLRQEEQAEYQRLTNQYFDQQIRRYMDLHAFSNPAVRDSLRQQAMTDARELAAAHVMRQIRESGSNLAQRYLKQSSAA